MLRHDWYENYFLPEAAGLAFLLRSGQGVQAQPVVSTSPPLMINLAEIDCSHVYAHSPKGALGQWRPGILLRDVSKLKVDELVRHGVPMQSPVWVIDGQKVLLKIPPVVGEAVRHHDARDEAGQRGVRTASGFQFSGRSRKGSHGAAVGTKPLVAASWGWKTTAMIFSSNIDRQRPGASGGGD